MDLIGEARRNWDERGLDELEAMVSATSIARAHQIVLGRINEALAQFSLTFSRYEALALLSFARNGAMAMARMGERLQVHPTSVTSTIDRLERDKLVKRAPHPDDRRATLATVTPRGRKVLDDATAALEAIRWGMGDITDAELVDLNRAAAAVRESAGDNIELEQLT
ncbi:MAG: MarR family transcriptional regulator [Acidimicrobiales bacterium]|nr:MarR family transcriptional regulator [Acidimicrobiales bacterium]RZV44271.1 MAG: MarR family transcriptional regulator [Acidimicrobiales bacterium]